MCQVFRNRIPTWQSGVSSGQIMPPFRCRMVLRSKLQPGATRTIFDQPHLPGMFFITRPVGVRFTHVENLQSTHLMCSFPALRYQCSPSDLRHGRTVCTPPVFVKVGHDFLTFSAVFCRPRVVSKHLKRYFMGANDGDSVSGCGHGSHSATKACKIAQSQARAVGPFGSP